MKREGEKVQWFHSRKKSNSSKRKHHHKRRSSKARSSSRRRREHGNKRKREHSAKSNQREALRFVDEELDRLIARSEAAAVASSSSGTLPGSQERPVGVVVQQPFPLANNQPARRRIAPTLVRPLDVNPAQRNSFQQVPYHESNWYFNTSPTNKPKRPVSRRSRRRLGQAEVLKEHHPDQDIAAFQLAQTEAAEAAKRLEELKDQQPGVRRFRDVVDRLERKYGKTQTSKGKRKNPFQQGGKAEADDFRVVYNPNYVYQK